MSRKHYTGQKAALTIHFLHLISLKTLTGRLCSDPYGLIAPSSPLSVTAIWRNTAHNPVATTVLLFTLRIFLNHPMPPPTYHPILSAVPPLIRLTYNGIDTSAAKKARIIKYKLHTPEQNKWDCHLIAPNYHFDKWKNIKAGKQMTPHAPPAPCSQ